MEGMGISVIHDKPRRWKGLVERGSRSRVEKGGEAERLRLQKED